MCVWGRMRRKGDLETSLFSRTCLKLLEERRATGADASSVGGWGGGWRGERPWRGWGDVCLLILSGVVGLASSGSGELDCSRSRSGRPELIVSGGGKRVEHSEQATEPDQRGKSRP